VPVFKWKQFIFSIVFQVLERMRNSSAFSVPLPGPRIAVLGLMFCRSLSLFISKVRFRPFCATYCIASWSKCDHVLCGKFRTTFISFADSARKLNHASYKNRIMFRVYLSSKEPAVRRSFTILFIAVKETVDARFFKEFGHFLRHKCYFQNYKNR